MSDTRNQVDLVESTDEQIDTSRRDALKKMGKYTAYTAPALLTMLTPKKGRAGVMSPPPMMLP